MNEPRQRYAAVVADPLVGHSEIVGWHDDIESAQREADALNASGKQATVIRASGILGVTADHGFSVRGGSRHAIK